MASDHHVAALDGSSHTSCEVHQQPEVWELAIANLDHLRGEIDAWLAPILARPDLRIILTGAGSSAYIGEALAPALTAALGRPVVAISTTAIVADPMGHLVTERPTLLISYARSGGSPESLATVQLADQLVGDCHHLVLSCNPQGELALACARSDRRFLLLMPDQANDQSFAMTSSFTAMLVSTLHLFLPDADQARLAIETARKLVSIAPRRFTNLIDGGFGRMIFLGSAVLHGIATEAALKSLELTAGRTVAIAESALGFRHGPKFMIDKDTLVILLTSSDPYTRLHDLDLAAELCRDGTVRRLIRLDELPELAGITLAPCWLAPVYLVWCQRLALHIALAIGIDPDNPSPTGELNRVVRGVTLHPFPSAPVE